MLTAPIRNTREETWHVPGSGEELKFDQGLLQHHLDDITSLLTTLASAAREFAENQERSTKA
jgi:hypothetical protein